jgi:predicted dienelactone hydrolase
MWAMSRPAALLLLAALGLAIACSDGASGLADYLADPGAGGPYAVGVTHVTFTRPSTANGTPRALESWVWYPADGDAGQASDGAPPAGDGVPYPLVVYSHGSGGMPENQSFFTEHLASWGFVVVAPPHPGNTTADCALCDLQNIAASAVERPDDVAFVLDELTRMRDAGDEPIGPLIDLERTAIAGHSFGGWTGLRVAPGGDFDAVVSMAPGLPLSLVPEGPSIRVPVMLIAGAKDEIVPQADVDALYEALDPATTSYVLLPEGHHLTFIDRCLGCTDALPEARGHELTNRYATAFLKVHVAGDERFAEYLVADPPDAEITGGR